MTPFPNTPQHLLQHQPEQENRQTPRDQAVAADFAPTSATSRPFSADQTRCPHAAIRDQRLLAMLQSPDEATRRAGWAAWYRRDQAKLKAYICRRSAGLRCSGAADDIVQDAFVIGFRYISEGKYEDRGRALLALLYGIAHNLVRSAARQRRRESEDNRYLDFAPATALSVEHKIVVAQVMEAVRAIYAELSDGHRNVIEGLYGEAKASHVLGAELGKKATNIRAIAHRAIKSICQRLADEYDLHLSADAVRTCLQMM